MPKITVRINKAESLANFIRSHGIPCRIIGTGYREIIRVATAQRATVQSRSVWVVRELPADKQAVLNYLGY